MAGRKRKNAGALREPICFSVDPAAKKMAQELRKAGFRLGEHIEAFIADKWCWYFNQDFPLHTSE